MSIDVFAAEKGLTVLWLEKNALEVIVPAKESLSTSQMTVTTKKKKKQEI